MTEPEPLAGLDYTLAVEFPALLICEEGDCGAHRVAESAEAGAEFLTEHASRYHERRFIRFRLQSQKPTDLAALLHPFDTAPEGWQDGPYDPHWSDRDA